ncbi:MAG TPA: sulfurtransferase [Candidatus Didemnitutus sp.]|nr:sulfurtransferase [Candidatus Didemnitutus sp.]
MLVSTETLAAHLNDPDWVVFDCRHDLKDFARGGVVYAAGHVPGAFFAAVETDLSGPKTGRNGRHPLPDPAKFAAFLSARGVTDSSRIVAYDDMGNQYAARLWWMTRWIGLRGAAVLDGGWPKWVAEKRPETHLVPPLRHGHVAAKVDAGMVVRTDEVVKNLGGSGLVVVDARAAERFRGETEPIDPVAGRIPGARNRFFKSNLRDDQTFRPAAELRGDFEDLLGGTPLNRVAHQCGSGVTGCVNLLAMELAGLSGSKLYAGSWSEWIADPARPVARGA